MRHSTYFIIIFIYCVLLSCTRDDTLHARLDTDYRLLKRSDSILSLYTSKGEWTKALSYAYSSDSASSGRDVVNSLQAYAYIGQCYLATDCYDSCRTYLEKGLAIWESVKHSQPENEFAYKSAYVLYNSLGIYTVNIENDYEKAMRYFTDGSKIASSRGDKYYNMVFLSNMAVVSNIRKDTSGIKYAAEIYKYGICKKDTSTICNGAYLQAAFYLMKGELSRAKEMLNRALQLTDPDDLRYGEMLNLYAEILYKDSLPSEAERYYESAMKYTGHISASAATAIYLSYGHFLLQEKRFSEAIRVLKKGTGIAEDSDNRVHKYQLYLSLSQAYEAVGNTSAALAYHKKYSTESENAINIEKERAVNELTRKYEQEIYEQEIYRHNMEIVSQKRALAISIAIASITAGLSAVILSMYRKKDRLYSKIVKQYRDEFEKKQKNEIQTAAAGKDIFDKVEKLIKYDGKYRDNSLTRDSLAEMIGTNRTYLSKVVNEKTGMSFVNYLNSYRIEKSLEILSDSDDNTPLKAIGPAVGFNSMSTFYKLFREKVGMTPAKYRQKIIEISKNDNLTKTA